MFWMRMRASITELGAPPLILLAWPALRLKGRLAASFRASGVSASPVKTKYPFRDRACTLPPRTRTVSSCQPFRAACRNREHVLVAQLAEDRAGHDTQFGNRAGLDGQTARARREIVRVIGVAPSVLLTRRTAVVCSGPCRPTARRAGCRERRRRSQRPPVAHTGSVIPSVSNNSARARGASPITVSMVLTIASSRPVAPKGSTLVTADISTSEFRVNGVSRRRRESKLKTLAASPVLEAGDE